LLLQAGEISEKGALVWHLGAGFSPLLLKGEVQLCLATGRFLSLATGAV